MKKAIALFVLVLAAGAFVACGDDTGASTETKARSGTSEPSTFAKEHPGSAVYGSPPLEFEADPDGDLAFTQDEVMAKEGNVTIEFTNPQPVRHNVVVEAANSAAVKTNTIEDGFDYVTISLNDTEKFIFYCSVPGHRKAGMEGVIKVTERPGWTS